MSEAHFVDTSALVKRYVVEPGTEALARRTFDRDDVTVFVSALTYAETYATFTRLARDGDLTAADLEATLAAFETDWRSFVVVEHGEAVRRHIPPLASRFALRGSDLVQLASAVHLHARRALTLFVACDVRLANAAVGANLPLFNPELESAG